jgi:hypothetical protein
MYMAQVVRKTHASFEYSFVWNDMRRVQIIHRYRHNLKWLLLLYHFLEYQQTLYGKDIAGIFTMDKTVEFEDVTLSMAKTSLHEQLNESRSSYAKYAEHRPVGGAFMSTLRVSSIGSGERLSTIGGLLAMRRRRLLEFI